MNIGSAFPSRYLKASDLQGKKVTRQISHVTLEDIGDDAEKPVLYFEGGQKGLVLNRTNANLLSSHYGNETDDWKGKPVMVYPTKVQFKSQMVDAIRLDVPAEEASPDEIPF